MRRPSVRLAVWLFPLAVACGGTDPEPSDASEQGGADALGGVSASAGGSSHTGGKTGSAGNASSGGATGAGGAHPGSGGSSGASSTGGAHPGVGGSGGAGGSGGSGGGPVHVVGACDGLGAVDKWDEITPPGLSGSLSLVADPVHAGTVYVGTDKKGLYRSTDCGATWLKVNTGRNGDVLDSGLIWSMAIDPIEPNVLFLGSLYGSDLSLQKSTNSGVDWDAMFPPGSEVANTVEYNFTQEVSMDMTDHKHLVVSFHNNCKGAYAPTCMAETKDSGATWRLFKGPTQGWVENARPLVLGATSWLYMANQDGMYYTADSGASWEFVVNLKMGGHQLYKAADGTYYVGGESGILKSKDGHVWSLISGAPQGDALIGDGTRIFTDYTPWAGSNNTVYYSTPENDGTKWTVSSSPPTKSGADYFAYDPDHRLLYSSNRDGGVWRAVTK